MYPKLIEHNIAIAVKLFVGLNFSATFPKGNFKVLVLGAAVQKCRFLDRNIERATINIIIPNTGNRIFLLNVLTK